MPRGFPGPTVKTPAKTPTARRGKTSSATPTPDNQPLQPSDGWATKSLQKPKPRGKGRPFQPGNPYGRPKGSKNKVKPLEKPKRKATGKPFEPGNCNGGRPKGSKNKFSRDLKEAYLLAANAAGGLEGLVGYLKKQALLENPSPFMTGLSKLLPMMLEGNPDAPLIVERVYYTRDQD
jgi:hypothetical protein